MFPEGFFCYKFYTGFYWPKVGAPATVGVTISLVAYNGWPSLKAWKD